MSDLVAQTLWIYGLAAAVSLAVAALVKLVVVVLTRPRRVAGAAPVVVASRSAAVGAAPAHDDDDAPPAEHVAAIGAAVYAAIGAHRILHIEDAARDRSWTAGGREAHHRSHSPIKSHTPIASRKP